VDERGRPHALRLGPGQQADCRQAAALLAAAPVPRYVLADKAYDTNALVEQGEQLGAEVVIPSEVVLPSKRNRLYCRLIDRVRYRQRNQVERFFNRLKQFRRLATRYEKTAARFLGFVLFFAARCWC
jgi:putative transposase